MNQLYNNRITGLTARNLFAKSRRGIAQDIIQEQIKVIDAEINAAHTAGFNYVVHDLPVNFNISGMDKSDAQTLIYSEILSIYKQPEPHGKGFVSVFIERGEHPKIHIGWINGMDDQERQQRMALIRSCYLPEAKKKT